MPGTGLLSACVVYEWGSVLVLHRRNPKRWELAISGEGTEEGAVEAAREKMGIELAVKRKLLQTERLVLFQAEVRRGVPRAVDEKTYDRVRYMEIPVLWKKPEELSEEVRVLLEAIKEKRVRL